MIRLPKRLDSLKDRRELRKKLRMKCLKRSKKTLRIHLNKPNKTEIEILIFLKYIHLILYDKV